MDHSTIPLILREINLNDRDVANIYHHGSWVYGTNSPTSDRDLIIVTRSPSRTPVIFRDDFNYFHEFELHRLWNEYDVCVYSVANFETLLKRNYLSVVQCVFLPDEFKLKEDIDFRTIYLEKYYNKLTLKQVVFYEMARYLNLFDTLNYSDYTDVSTRNLETIQSRQNYVFKNLFHGLRYLDFVEQLIETGSIHNFKRASYLFDRMKDIRGDPTDDLSQKRVAKFVRRKTTEYKSRLDTLVPANIIKGLFKAYITFDCSHNTVGVIEKLEKRCEKTKYKTMFIEFDKQRVKDEPQEQLIVSSHYNGEYPSIVKQIKEEVYQDFQDFRIIRIKILALASNEGVPQTDMDKILFWDERTNYFEFRYEIEVRKNRKQDVQDMCQRYCGFDLDLSHNAFQRMHGRHLPYMITMRLSDMGKEQALKRDEEVVDCLTRHNFPPSKCVCEFSVYDSYIQLDKD